MSSHLKSMGIAALAIDAEPNAVVFNVAIGAFRLGRKNAPVPGYPSRIRPQLVLSLEEGA